MEERFRSAAYALITIGVILTAVSVFADPLALGVPNSGFGWKQFLGTGVGLLVTGVGVWWARRDGRE